MLMIQVCDSYLHHLIDLSREDFKQLDIWRNTSPLFSGGKVCQPVKFDEYIISRARVTIVKSKTLHYENISKMVNCADWILANFCIDLDFKYWSEMLWLANHRNMLGEIFFTLSNHGTSKVVSGQETLRLSWCNFWDSHANQIYDYLVFSGNSI